MLSTGLSSTGGTFAFRSRTFHTNAALTARGGQHAHGPLALKYSFLSSLHVTHLI